MEPHRFESLQDEETSVGLVVSRGRADSWGWVREHSGRDCSKTVSVSLENLSSEGERPPFPVDNGGAKQQQWDRARKCTEFVSPPTWITWGRGMNRETDAWIA